MALPAVAGILASAGGAVAGASFRAVFVIVAKTMVSLFLIAVLKFMALFLTLAGMVWWGLGSDLVSDAVTTWVYELTTLVVTVIDGVEELADGHLPDASVVYGASELANMVPMLNVLHLFDAAFVMFASFMLAIFVRLVRAIVPGI